VTPDRNVATRFFDGDGREVKRQTFDWVATANSAYWSLREPKYYVRSSVLGGETVSEVFPSGAKQKTIVRAAGAVLANQYLSGANASVVFEYSDASGMSSRSGGSDGSVLVSDGGEGSPSESDPMGSNVGTTTPYIIDFQPYQPPEEYPFLQSLYEDSPQYVNGQRLSCSLNGFGISCARAFDALQSGSAIIGNIAQYRNAVSTLGIGGTIVEVPETPGTGNGCENGGCPDVLNGAVVTVNAPTSTFIVIPSFSVVSWNPRGQVPLPENGQGTGGGNNDKDKVRSSLDFYLQYKSIACEKALKALGLTDKKLLDGFDKNTFFSGGSIPKSASTSMPYRTVGKQKIRGNTTTTTMNGVVDFFGTSSGYLIHELAHAVTGLGDVAIYRALSNAQDRGNISGLPVLSNVDKKNKIAASVAISTYLNKACGSTDGVDPPNGNAGSTSG